MLEAVVGVWRSLSYRGVGTSWDRDNGWGLALSGRTKGGSWVYIAVYPAGVVMSGTYKGTEWRVLWRFGEDPKTSGTLPKFVRQQIRTPADKYDPLYPYARLFAVLAPEPLTRICGDKIHAFGILEGGLVQMLVLSDRVFYSGLGWGVTHLAGKKPVMWGSVPPKVREALSLG